MKRPALLLAALFVVPLAVEAAPLPRLGAEIAPRFALARVEPRLDLLLLPRGLVDELVRWQRGVRDAMHVARTRLAALANRAGVRIPDRQHPDDRAGRATPSRPASAGATIRSTTARSSTAGPTSAASTACRSSPPADGVVTFAQSAGRLRQHHLRRSRRRRRHRVRAPPALPRQAERRRARRADDRRDRLDGPDHGPAPPLRGPARRPSGRSGDGDDGRAARRARRRWPASSPRSRSRPEVQSERSSAHDPPRHEAAGERRSASDRGEAAVAPGSPRPRDRPSSRCHSTAAVTAGPEHRARRYVAWLRATRARDRRGAPAAARRARST